ncbi:MAG: NTP transferase domain-containing protein [Acetobacteraceae bacterium]
MAICDESGPLAIILAAGIGRRLALADGRPKILLEFGRRSLLERHLAALHAHGVVDVSITIGHEGADVRREIDRLGLEDRVSFVENPRYREGSLISLYAQAERLNAGRTILLMDGDVLYDTRMIGRLLAAPAENVLLIDRAIEPGDEPVKICMRGGVIVDFHKTPRRAHDWYGESVGFFRFSPASAAELAGRCAAYLDRGRGDLEYEEAIRDLILEEPPRFGAEDISDLAWTEIDFDADVIRARQEILPQLEG